MVILVCDVKKSRVFKKFREEVTCRASLREKSTVLLTEEASVDISAREAQSVLLSPSTPKYPARHWLQVLSVSTHAPRLRAAHEGECLQFARRTEVSTDDTVLRNMSASELSAALSRT